MEEKAMKCARGVVMCSGSASSLRYLREHDPNFGKLYRIVGVFSNVSEASGISYALESGIDTCTLDFRNWRSRRGIEHGDLKAREAYFAEVLALIQKGEPDFIILSGFMLLVTEPLLSKYAGRILNVHPALLDILDTEGKPKYTGLNVVERAMEAGDPTGSTVHIIIQEADMGPIVALSAPLPYKPGDDPKAHQERMKTACDGPAFAAALEKMIRSDWRLTA